MSDFQSLYNTIQEIDALSLFKMLPDESVHTIVTSPPYFGQRDYGAQNQIGLEITPDAYVESLVKVFQEARRTLRPDGTFWLNIGDSYVGATSQHREGGSQGKTSRYSKKHMNGVPQTGRGERNRALYALGLPMKSLLGIPWRVAFALQSDGWLLRCDIIWHRPSSSESVKDRPTHAHEYIFMFSKKQKYYYDREPLLTPTGANIQSVWQVTGSPFTGSHCAPFPSELIEPIILGACPEGGVVVDPFGGSGTVGVVCQQHNRKFIMCDVSSENVELARKRVTVGITKDDKRRLAQADSKQESLPMLHVQNRSVVARSKR